MSTSTHNAEILEKLFKDSPFENIKFFIDPTSSVSQEACTEEALSILPELVSLNDGVNEPQYVL